jgi:hypothetical protein
MDYRKLITIEDGKMVGNHAFAVCGSRSPTYWTTWLPVCLNEEILRDFPDLREEDLRACLGFAADRDQRLTLSTT